MQYYKNILLFSNETIEILNLNFKDFCKCLNNIDLLANDGQNAILFLKNNKICIEYFDFICNVLIGTIVANNNAKNQNINIENNNDNHDDTVIHQCDKCNEIFDSEIDLLLHMKTHNKTKMPT